MIMYEVIIQENAENDLLAIIEYISDCLCEKEIAVKIYRDIMHGILSLETMPKRCSVIDKEPYRSDRIRRLIVGNYSAFYVVDDEEKTVHIIHIVYNRREWQNII